MGYVQSNLAATTGGGVTTNTCAFTSPTTTGNHLVAMASSYGFTQEFDTCTDNKGNVWQFGGANADDGGDLIALWYCPNATGGSGHQVTITTTEAENITIIVAEYSGVKTSSPLDASGAGSGNGSTVLSDDITTSQNGCLIIGLGVDVFNLGTPSTGSGYTMRQHQDNPDNQMRLYMQDRIQTNAGTINSAFGLNSSEDWAALIFAFLPVPVDYGDTDVPGTAGPSNPGTLNNIDNAGGIGWVNIGNAATEDGSSATWTASTNGAVSDYFQALNFGFSIPLDAIIDGVQVRIKWSQTSTQLMIPEGLYLENNGGTSVGDDKLSGSTVSTVPTTLTWATFGGATDDWNTGYGPADFNMSDFGISFTVRKTSSSSRVFSVDAVEITVYYHTVEAGGPPTPGSQSQSSMMMGIGGDGTGNTGSNPDPGGGGVDPDPGGGGGSGNDYDATPPANPGSGKTWSRTFFDNFSGTTLDSSKWSHLYPWGAVSNGANGESQWYDESAVSVSNSNLIITATREPATVYGYDYDYKAGLIQTYNKFSQRYGYYDGKMKFPAGQGFWPAFWLLQNSSSFPWPPELDIVEQLGNEPNDYHATVHTVDQAGNYSQWPNVQSSSTPFTQYHIIGMHWTATFIDWYLDNVFWMRLTPDSTFVIPNVAMYYILNYAVGGNWPGYPNNQTVFPSYFQVDWVRAFAAV